MGNREEAARASLDNGESYLIITGAPGAGKSTVASLVVNSLARSALLVGDHVAQLVVSGRVWALGEPADESARQVRLCNDNICALASNIADAGFTPVIDWIIPDNAQLDIYRHALSTKRLLLVVLAPSVDTCRRRNATRHPEEQYFFDGYSNLIARMRTGFGSLGWWFDTTDLTPEQTASEIVTHAPARAAIRT